MSTADFRHETADERAARIETAIRTAQALVAQVDSGAVWSDELIAERRAEAQRDLLDETSS